MRQFTAIFCMSGKGFQPSHLQPYREILSLNDFIGQNLNWLDSSSTWLAEMFDSHKKCWIQCYKNTYVVCTKFKS